MQSIDFNILTLIGIDCYRCVADAEPLKRSIPVRWYCRAFIDSAEGLNIILDLFVGTEELSMKGFVSDHRSSSSLSRQIHVCP